MEQNSLEILMERFGVSSKQEVIEKAISILKQAAKSNKTDPETEKLLDELFSPPKKPPPD